jgi:putative nucleotidyltransferase with HDIG domain
LTTTAAAALEVARRALGGEQAWVVGGTVRDALLGRPGAPDVDIVVAGDVRTAARRVARASGAAAFELSGTHGAWRVVDRGGAWQIDIVAMQGGSLEEDLAARDLTLNAMAEPLGGGPIVDPYDGRADIAARQLRMVAPEAFDRDPLRVLRVARFASELGFGIEPATRAAARARAGRVAGVAGERVFAELKRIVGGDDPVRGIALLDELALMPAVLPEVDALRGVEQSVYHHRDVFGHTLEVLEAAVALERDPGDALGDDLAGRVRAFLSELLADDVTRGGALRWAALLHDVAKPQTRVELPGGRVGFPHHDSLGAELVREALTRLRASERLRAHVAAMTRHHLRLGFLVHEAPLDRRAIHRYLVATAPVAADVTLLTVADRLATRGRKAGEAIARHLELARVLVAAALEQRAAGRRPPLIRGDALAAELGLQPGPRLGELLAAIEEARYAGEVVTPGDAVALARALLRAADQPAPRDSR